MNAEEQHLQAQCDRWIRLFSELSNTGAPGLGQLQDIAVADVQFRDPFNDVTGLAWVQRLLEHTRRQVSALCFIVHDTAWSGTTAYVRWTMTGRVRVIGDWRVEGVSEIRFAEDGRVAAHIDHWDSASQFYGRLPVIGWLLRHIAAKARIS
jgi:hypothetical protein